MKKFSLAIVLIFGWCSVTNADDFPWLASLDANDGVQASGARLVARSEGLYALEQVSPQITELLVAVHGWRSRGYEWVYPLQTMNTGQRHVLFFSWDTEIERCLLEVKTLLLDAIKVQLSNHADIEAVTVVGHSLGGLLVALLADAWDADVPLTIHTIAAPLAHLASEAHDCPRSLPERSRHDVRFIQWRTRFELDNAFNQLDHNPMVVDVPDSIVVDLPESYRDRRLGHNWSVSYVSERIAAGPATATP